ncbi:Cupin 2 conserved barrel domain protein [Catenulispora acidiphila DSM 44928]|uniref:Cupin 2 conserved barrel domain protein n=1 Tax=Catenulispora acidiphila (strain DSM 44928 / JCM 14897 / NBRC 102108 / NRRL B-24433 / ID139908) TaxID=479433 RepID=C7Q722_CATAD|nr:cupin domain-containing protein [Catenulispora acidiphila]ACU76035.1 Cupin 2 conserved barrel domain protein [Catenulispora acidiphila DSM 44928]
MQISRAPRTGVPASSEWITGGADIEELATPAGPSRTQVDSVRFAPGARTHWHRHPLGQVLVVTDGTALVQRRGGGVEAVQTGDSVRIEAGEWHWHGATPDAAMTHLAVEELPEDGRIAEFGDTVTNAEYGAGREAESEAQAESGAQSEPAPPLSRVVVMDQKLPEALATQRVEIRRITIAPGYAAGLHVHNGPVFGSIETGSAVYQIEGESAVVLRPGDVFHEPEGVRIARFDAQQDGVTFLGYFLLADGLDAELVFVED